RPGGPSRVITRRPRYQRLHEIVNALLGRCPSRPLTLHSAHHGQGPWPMDSAIVGGGIGGLTLALALHQHGIPCRVYESAPEVRELGVGITLLPHAMRELSALGLGEALARPGIRNGGGG